MDWKQTKMAELPKMTSLREREREKCKEKRINKESIKKENINKERKYKEKNNEK